MSESERAAEPSGAKQSHEEMRPEAFASGMQRKAPSSESFPRGPPAVAAVSPLGMRPRTGGPEPFGASRGASGISQGFLRRLSSSSSGRYALRVVTGGCNSGSPAQL